MADEPAVKLDIDAVVKAYGDRTVLDGLSVSVAEHEVVCLIGPSGCGKSTLLRCVDLLDPIDAGDIRLDGRSVIGRDVDADAVRRRIGIVF